MKIPRPHKGEEHQNGNMKCEGRQFMSLGPLGTGVNNAFGALIASNLFCLFQYRAEPTEDTEGGFDRDIFNHIQKLLNVSNS